MQTAVLDVIRWPKVSMKATECAALAAHFQPLGVAGERGPGLHGQAVWGKVEGEAPVGIAWDWTEIAPDVVVLADPMVVVSNLELLDEGGQPMSRASCLLALNAAIHGLNWQTAILEKAPHSPRGRLN